MSKKQEINMIQSAIVIIISEKAAFVSPTRPLGCQVASRRGTINDKLVKSSKKKERNMRNLPNSQLAAPHLWCLQLASISLVWPA